MSIISTVIVIIIIIDIIFIFSFLGVGKLQSSKEFFEDLKAYHYHMYALKVYPPEHRLWAHVYCNFIRVSFGRVRY